MDHSAPYRRPSRRRFVQALSLAGLGLVVGCGRLPFQAQPPPRVPRVGFLNSGASEARTVPPPGTGPGVDAFFDGLRELGYVDGQNVIVEWRATGGGEVRLRELAAELVRLPVDVLVTGAGTTEFAREVTDTVPIVFVGGADPVASGLVASYARPGGNITGLTVGAPVIAKQFELLKEVAPGISRVAVLRDANLKNPPVGSGQLGTSVAALGLHVQPMDVRSADDLPDAFHAASGDRVDGLQVVETPLLRGNQGRITELALQYRLPSISQFREYAAAGGLLAYGPNLPALYRRAATYVDKILQGVKPADLPIEQPREFTFAVNLKTAQALGLTIPQSVFIQATETIR